MIHCPVCEKKLPDTVEVCLNCGAPVTKLIKEPENHGFHFLVVNSLDIPTDC
ncbi:MAG: zinc-ribbon domain-containing protein [Promethearchaeota archaeon]